MGSADTSLDELGRRFQLALDQVDRLRLILDAIASDELAPTTVRATERALEIHLADSLVALEHASLREARRIVDIGSGAGFPGLPLAVALPEVRVVLLDSQSRKCAFIERVAARTGLSNVQAVCARVEEWPEGIGAHDFALARAVSAAPVVLEYAAPLLRLGGTLLDWRGRRDPGEEQAAERAAEQLGMKRESIVLTSPYASAHDHHLHVYVKTGETPGRFPRRAGMARKRPLAK